MRTSHYLPFLAAPLLAEASSILFNGGTIVAFNRNKNALEVIRDGSLLINDDRIVSVSAGAPSASLLRKDTEVVDAKGKIITPGFIDTHKHGWQTSFKTLASNTSLLEYFSRYGEFAAAGLLTAEDVYIGQLAGIYEALHGGVTTILDHAHHAWSNQTAEAGLLASVDSGARIFWAYAFHNIPSTPPYLVPEQLAHFRALAGNTTLLRSSPTSLGVAYDAWDPAASTATERQAVVALATSLNVSVVTTHTVLGPWGLTNTPSALLAAGILNTSIPVVLSHGSFLSPTDAQLLRTVNQYVSVTPESEFHYGHSNPTSHRFLDQAALGVDTHFTYSGDILSQARLWLQTARLRLYEAVLERWELPVNNPMSATQAFLLATRNGGLALRREDLGVIAVGAKADVVVWDGDAPALLGWNDPVAAVILHASVGDVESVVVDGKWRKRDFKIVVGDGKGKGGYEAVKKRFVESARRVQKKLIETKSPVPVKGDVWPYSGYLVGEAETVDVLRGEGTGYGTTFLKA
ncbi:amidohydrolase [Schizothecium vesticola]|uniref:Amidohydrolase n=1 Tax=Schizothecium vesticola TaxID=314040 RepID=A0AA40BPQ0_9PEZI|nr:amidohydrolase [Schizothecium vesticola]